MLFRRVNIWICYNLSIWYKKFQINMFIENQFKWKLQIFDFLGGGGGGEGETKYVFIIPSAILFSLPQIKER